MRLERSKEWWLKRALAEGEAVIAAGLGARDPAPPAAEEPRASRPDGARYAFGRLVNMMRRRNGLTIEGLAEEARVEARELLVIEDDVNHVPGPRTVYQLARVFDVPQARLMQLAGLVIANDAGLVEEAIRFAARAEGVHKLAPEESAALAAFIAVLGRQEPKPDR